ncbi:hypothetical protein DNL40_08800 [Xylanimonas oleitrophica]|uniref:histidine kinase n=1 Tax=Xylanimonas oleitrophica TaxID=2607479 RepID=A0A2W5WXR2_9MICO|nr:ATP-binding protein [Xylanimonas oleitrophica]PZR53096.1 hypothetical protein DNL40_08800 [Xylanimonas oleitrophica]
MTPGGGLPGKELLRFPVRSDADVLELRRTGRSVAEGLGLDLQDQVRFATALSEVGRSAAAAGGGVATVTVRQETGESVLAVTLTTTMTMPVSGQAEDGGVPAARRLVDDVVVSSGPPTEVTLVKPLPAQPSTDRLESLRAALDSHPDTDALSQMRAHNAELIDMLEELSSTARQLEATNAELEETNRGVMAMYRQLSDELEETNSGVVALYAELDERGRQLAAANEAKTRFLRHVSHELRTPVNSIIGLVSLLDDSPLDAEQRRQVSFLQDSATALLGLVNELLDLARAESGRQEVTLSDVDLPALLAELHGTTAPLVRDGVVLEVADAPRAVVRTDRHLLARVLRNLLTNAVKFTERGSVRLTVEERDGELWFAVTDTGIGIAPEHLEEVFEEFAQIPNHLQPTVRGTGLGLPYARRLMETLGGRLEASSVPGEGSTFVAVLPPALPDGTAAGIAASSGSSAGAGAGVAEGAMGPVAGAAAEADARFPGRALVVDDDDAYRALVVESLRGAGARVTQAATVAAAVDAVRGAQPGEAPDVVVLDVRMPDGDGVEAVVRLRELRPDLPVVLMSSGPAPQLPPQARDVPFVGKDSRDRTALLAAVRRVATAPGGAEGA